ncbi:transposable element Tcb2 transposase [Trichonephila clavipes]|nr:transposable element Tcb2 transposase [Trichonephila clavipes]
MVSERLSRHQMPTIMVDEMWHRVEATWASVPVLAIQSQFDSVPTCINVVITARNDCSWLVDAPCCWPGGSFRVCCLKLLEAVGTRRYPRAENRVWSEQWTPQCLVQRYQQTFNDTSNTVDPTVTRSTIRADVGVAIVPQTIFRHLAEANLKSKRSFHALPLTPVHRLLRLQCYQARSMWNVTDWQKVVFSDESRFVLGTDDNRVRVWRHPGEWYNSPPTVLRHTARTAGVMVRGTIAYDSRSTLIVMRGTLTGQRYVDDILRPHVRPFQNGLPGAIFQQDNARPHTARVSQDFLRPFQTLPWPARSPDLLPADHVWDQLKRQIPSCHSIHDLELAVQDL